MKNSGSFFGKADTLYTIRTLFKVVFCVERFDNITISRFCQDFEGKIRLFSFRFLSNIK